MKSRRPDNVKNKYVRGWRLEGGDVGSSQRHRDASKRVRLFMKSDTRDRIKEALAVDCEDSVEDQCI